MAEPDVTGFPEDLTGLGNPVRSGPRTLVVGLGNPILGDDGVGWRVVQETQGLFLGDDYGRSAAEDAVAHPIEFDCVSLGGLALMERLIGYDRAVVVDAIQTRDGKPGAVYRLGLDDLPTLHAGSAHDASLKEAIELGRRLGALLPADIAVVAIEAPRAFDFRETLSTEVEEGVPAAVQVVRQALEWGRSVPTQIRG
jgi:hydrogenase maturation protease